MKEKIFSVAVLFSIIILIACGSDSGSGSGEFDNVAIDDMLISGFSQKGPFVLNSTVTANELQDGKTLKQTGKNFTGTIKSDDGLFDIKSVTLASQYAYIVVDGFYRNEVTGENSSAPIKLQTLTDLTLRSTANVNLLTHLEYDRVVRLVTQNGLSVRKAKAQAESELMKAFYIDLSLKTNFEDLNIFSAGDENAALLAVSIMMQGDLSEADFSIRLANFARDIESDGEWNDEKTKAAIADWIYAADYTQFRSNVEGWNLGEVPKFEKYLDNFWWQNYGLGNCDNTREGEIVADSNVYSAYYYGLSNNADEGNDLFQTRFICRSGEWIYATDLERDTYGEKCSIAEVGNIISGKKNKSYEYYCSGSGWATFKGGWSWNVPKELRFNPNIKYGSMKDSRDNHVYKTVIIDGQTWMAENLNYTDSVKTPSLKGKSWCYDNNPKNCDIVGRLYTWAAAIDSVSLEKDTENSQTCGYGVVCSLPEIVQGVCPDGWHLPNHVEWENLVASVGGEGEVLRSSSGWSFQSGEDAGSEDAYGLSILPAGYTYGEEDKIFTNIGNGAHFWLSSEGNEEYAHHVRLGGDPGFATVGSYTKVLAFSVRCIQNN